MDRCRSLLLGCKLVTDFQPLQTSARIAASCVPLIKAVGELHTDNSVDYEPDDWHNGNEDYCAYAGYENLVRGEFHCRVSGDVAEGVLPDLALDRCTWITSIRFASPQSQVR